MLKNKKIMIITGGIVFLIGILLVAKLVFFKKNQEPLKRTTEIPNEVIPTVDSSVMVSLESIKKGEISLIVGNVPGGTKTIDFELSYEAANSDASEGAGASVSQGALGKCVESGDKWECGEPYSSGRKIVLGTCSSGVCRYHNVTSPIKVSLKFSGIYGEKIFEKEYTL